MRDLATYQSQAFSAINFKAKILGMRDLTMQTLEQFKRIGVQSEMFQDKLFEIVDGGINR